MEGKKLKNNSRCCKLYFPSLFSSNRCLWGGVKGGEDKQTNIANTLTNTDYFRGQLLFSVGGWRGWEFPVVFFSFLMIFRHQNHHLFCLANTTTFITAWIVANVTQSIPNRIHFSIVVICSIFVWLGMLVCINIYFLVSDVAVTDKYYVLTIATNGQNENNWEFQFFFDD